MTTTHTLAGAGFARDRVRTRYEMYGRRAGEPAAADLVDHPPARPKARAQRVLLPAAENPPPAQGAVVAPRTPP